MMKMSLIKAGLHDDNTNYHHVNQPLKDEMQQWTEAGIVPFVRKRVSVAVFNNIKYILFNLVRYK